MERRMAGRAVLLPRRATVFRRPKLRFIATVVLGIFVITYAASASTLFMPDADSATLVAILSNAIKTVSAMTAAQAADVEKWRRERPPPRPRIVEDPCETLQRRLSGQEVSVALERLFGSPASAPGTQQAAESRLSADAQQVRNTARAERARALLRMCQDVTESDLDTCQAAVMTAEAGSYQQLLELKD